MWPRTSTARLNNTDLWHLRSLHLLDRMKTKYREHFRPTTTSKTPRTFSYEQEYPLQIQGNYNRDFAADLRLVLGRNAPSTRKEWTSRPPRIFEDAKPKFDTQKHDAVDKFDAVEKFDALRTIAVPKLTALVTELQAPGKRAVLISGLTEGTTVPLVLAQLRGGVLEKIAYNEKNGDLEVFFFTARAAAEFMEMALNLGLFIVNGRSLPVRWSNSFEARSCEVRPLPNYVVAEVAMYKASRVVIFSKCVPGKPKVVVGEKRTYPNAKLHFSQAFDIEMVKWDFVLFGGIVEVMPMVSHNLSVSIQFTDIRSALLAMHSMKQANSHLREKYPDWTLKYGNDPTLRPCLVL